MTIQETKNATPVLHIFSFLMIALVFGLLFNTFMDVSSPRTYLPEEYKALFSTPLDTVQITKYYWSHGILIMDLETKAGFLALKQPYEFKTVDPAVNSLSEKDSSPMFGSATMIPSDQSWATQIFFKPLINKENSSEASKETQKSHGVWIFMNAARSKAHVYCDRSSMLFNRP